MTWTVRGVWGRDQLRPQEIDEVNKGKKACYTQIKYEGFTSRGACGGENSEGGRCVRTKGTQPPAEVEPLEYTTPTPGCSRDVDREGSSERSTMTSRDRQGVQGKEGVLNTNQVCGVHN